MAIVIVGGGHAAGQAAASVRQEGFDGELIVVGSEPHIPYQRPPLSKQYLSGEYGIEKVYLRPAKFYDDKHIDLRPAVTVTGIDAVAHRITCDDGNDVGYDKLLLAVGARPRVLPIPGAELAGIHTLRTIEDVDAIRADMETARNVVIVGGGYIGLEVAAVAVAAGKHVTILEMEGRILQRVTTPEMSAFYHDLHTSRGATIRTKAAAASFQGAGRVESVLCGDGVAVDADLVVVGVGVVPNVELAEASGIACDNGITVDERCRTSDPDIYAAGDCTNHPNPILGRRLRLESVPNAMEQARVAAANMTGGDKTYASVPWFWSDQYELKLQMVGFSGDGDQQVMRGDLAARQFAVFYFKDGKVVAADAVNAPKEFMVAKQLIGKSADPAKLADSGIDLKTLLT